MKKIIIAIDGHSSTGKSTVAKTLAKTLNYKYVDTGAMYRVVTLFALRNDLIKGQDVSKDALIDALSTISINFEYNPEAGTNDVFLNGENVEDEIRQMRVSNHVSQIAKIKEVRQKLVAIQQNIGQDKGVVMDGRDIGSVVFPEAELKLFMTATKKVRAERRFQELQNKGEKISYDEVFQNVITRDELDSSRTNSPLIQAEDAIKIDNSDMTQDEQFQLILNLAHERIEYD